jgi:hypothetical protein
MISTVIRVPEMTGFPIITSGSETTTLFSFFLTPQFGFSTKVSTLAEHRKPLEKNERNRLIHTCLAVFALAFSPLASPEKTASHFRRIQFPFLPETIEPKKLPPGR